MTPHAWLSQSWRMPPHLLMLVQGLLWYFGFTSLLPEEAMLWLNAPHELLPCKA